MRRHIGLALLATMALAIGACSATGTVDETTVSSVVEEGSEQVNDVITEVEEEIEALETAIAGSEAADELQADFDELRAELVTAFSSISDDGTIDAPDMTAHLDDFQSDIEALGDDVSDELTAAWDALRQRIETMMS